MDDVVVNREGVAEPPRVLATGLEGRKLGRWRRSQSHRPSLRIEDRVVAYCDLAFVVSVMCEYEAARSS